VDMLTDDELLGKSQCVTLLLEWCRVVCALYNLKVLIMELSPMSSLLLVVYCQKTPDWVMTVSVECKYVCPCNTCMQMYTGVW